MALMVCLTLCVCGCSTQSPEATLADKVVGDWYCADYDLSWWFSDDGSGIVSKGSNNNDFTWKIVRDNEMWVDFGYDDTELYKIALIDKNNFTFEEYDGYIYECTRG